MADQNQGNQRIQNQNRQNNQAVTANTPNTPAPVRQDAVAVVQGLDTMGKTEDAVVISNRSEKPLTIGNYNFEEILGILVKKIIDKEINGNHAQRLLRTWFHSMSDEERRVFVANRVEADNVVTRLKGAVETLAQELPFLFTM